MSSIQASTETKYRTTFYLTEENKQLLDQIPRGKKTVLINEALSLLLKKIEREKDSKRLMKMIDDITPVPSKRSSEEMVSALRKIQLGRLNQ
jgi:hypothetical protein